VEVSRVMATGKRLVLRTTSNELSLHVGDRVRVLDAHLVATADDEFQPALVTMGAISEVFVVLKGSEQLVV